MCRTGRRENAVAAGQPYRSRTLYKDNPFEGSWEKLSQKDFDDIVERHERYLKGQRDGARAKLSMCDLQYMDLTGRNLSQADFTGALLCHAELDDANLTDTILFAADMRFVSAVGADLSRADVRGACLAGANLSHATLTDVDMRDGVLLRSKGPGGDLVPLIHDDAESGMEKAKLRGANLSRAKVSDSFIVQTDMTDCILRQAKFIRANLSLSNLTGCDLEGADFTDANLSGAIFHGAVLAGATLDNADFTGADLIGAIFDNVDLTKVDLSKAETLKSLDSMDRSLKQVIMDHMKWVASNGKEGVRAVLSKFDLSGQDLSKVNLAAADLSFCQLTGADLSRSDLIMADLSYADLRAARLTRADLRGAKLARANLKGADMTGVVMTAVNISNRAGGGEWRASLDSAKVMDAVLAGADLRNGDMTGADFRKADLRDANLSGSLLTDAKFDEADMRGTNIENTDKRGASGLPKPKDDDMID